MSVTYIGPKLRTERHRKIKIGTEVAHITHDSDTTSRSKVRSPGHFLTTVLARQVAAPVGMESVGRGKWGGEGRGHIVAAARLQLVRCCFHTLNKSIAMTFDTYKHCRKRHVHVEIQITHQ